MSDRSQPITIATSRFTHLASANGVPGDRQRLGERGDVGPEPIGHRHHQRILHQHLLGVGAGSVLREPEHVDVLARAAVAAPPHASRPASSAGNRPLPGHLAAGLVAEHDWLA